MAESRLSNRFSITEAKSLVKDLTRPNPYIYWCDFIATIVVGHSLFAVLRLAPLMFDGAGLWIARVVLFSVVAALYMRAAMFIHELVHLPKNEYKGFRIAWNLLCGIPFLIPSFLYYPHVDHHRRKHYGTDKDGEYLDLSHRHPANILSFVIAALVVPIAAVVRFLIMSPLAWIIPGFQGWMEKHASSMIIDVFYVRGDFGKEARRIMRLQEVACFLWLVGVIAIGAYLTQSWGDLPLLIQFYALSVTLIVINNVRTLGAHRWMGDGRELSFEEQLLDTVNYPHRAWVTELWGPVGTRYHALHHLFPSLPYHNLGIAHQRLMDGLPADSMYRETVRTTLTEAIFELWWRASNRKNTDHPIVEQSASTDNQKDDTVAA